MKTPFAASWTPSMFAHLSLLLLFEVYGATQWVNDEQESLKKMLESSEACLTALQLKIVVNRARRLAVDYEYILQEEYGYDEDRYEYQIDFNQEDYEIWKQAAKKKLTVKLVYDSITSGISQRLVDPYFSKVPYVEGYCHNRKEVRKFRFDRVIDIEMTDMKFLKKY